MHRIKTTVVACSGNVAQSHCIRVFDNLNKKNKVSEAILNTNKRLILTGAIFA